MATKIFEIKKRLTKLVAFQQSNLKLVSSFGYATFVQKTE